MNNSQATLALTIRSYLKFCSITNLNLMYSEWAGESLSWWWSLTVNIPADSLSLLWALKVWPSRLSGCNILYVPWHNEREKAQLCQSFTIYLSEQLWFSLHIIMYTATLTKWLKNFLSVWTLQCRRTFHESLKGCEIIRGEDILFSGNGI